MDLLPITVWQDGSVDYGTVDEQKALLETQINTERDRRIEDGFAFLGHRFQSRQSDRENILGLAIRARASGAQPGDLEWLTPGQPFVFIAADNVLVPMDAPTVDALCSAGEKFKSGLTWAGRINKDALNACTSFAEIEALELVWPEED